MAAPNRRDALSLADERSLLRRGIWAVLGATAAAFVVAAVISQTEALPTNIDWNFTPGWLVLSAPFLLALPGLHAELWRRILDDLGGHMPARKAWAIFNLGLLARYVPTQALLVVTRVAMASREGVPKRITLASVVYEVALQLAGAVVVGTIGVIELPSLRGDPWRWLVLAIPVLAIAALHPRLFARFSGVLLRRVGAEDLPRTLPFPTVLRLAAGYVFSFLIVGVGVLFFVRALHGIDTGDIPLVISAWSVGYVGSMVAFFVPGGLGVRDGAMAAVLAVAVPTAVAVGVAVALRIVQTGIELLYAAASVLYARRLPELATDDPGRSAPTSRQYPDAP